MATNTAQPTTSSSSAESRGKSEFWAGVKKLLKPLASLRLTVVLFALSIVLVLAGTLAQDTMSIEQVKNSYFKVWVAWLNLQLLFPSGFFPQGSPLGSFDLWIVFPGGKTLGLLMLLNLLAAHSVRFTTQSRGPRLWMGLGVIGVGVLVTAAVISSGMNTDSVYQPVLSWEKIWYLLLSSLAGLTLVSIYGAFTVPPEKKLLSWLLIALAAALLAATVWLGMRTFYQGVENARLEAPSMRILWQLLKGTFAGVVLLIGCMLAFKKRAGIVLLHGGVALLMISELIVNLQALETRITLFEGESTNYAYSIQETELAIVDPLSDETEDVIVVPQHMLEQIDKRISDDQLPFDIEVIRYYFNSTLLGPAQARAEEAQDFATDGLAHKYHLVAGERPVAAGTESEADLPVAYVRLYKKGSEEEIGTYLLGAFQSRLVNINYMGFGVPEFRQLIDLPERVAVADAEAGEEKTYEVSLRFKRYYHPYAIELLETGRRNYVGTNIPSNYFSKVSIEDPSRDQHIETEIWMNNPLRYAAHTFYQSGHSDQLGPQFELSTLQVVANTSWMIPYVSCMIVGVGMLFQFSLTLSRFLNRQQKELLSGESIIPAAVSGGAFAVDVQESKLASNIEPGVEEKISQKVNEAKLATPTANQPAPSATSERGMPGANWALAGMLVLVCGVWLLRESRAPNEPPEGEMNLYAAGQIPVTSGGRVQPLDSLARNELRILAGKQTLQAWMNAQELKENWDDVLTQVRYRWPEVTLSQLEDLKKDDQQVTLNDIVALVVEVTGIEPQEAYWEIGGFASTKQPAMRWMMDLLARPDQMIHHRVIHIENLELLDQLGLPRRPGYRYSYRELQLDEEVREAFRRELLAASEVKEVDMTFYQRKLSELHSHVRRYERLIFSFYVPIGGNDPMLRDQFMQDLRKGQAPLLAPPLPGETMEDWKFLPDVAVNEQSRASAGLEPAHEPVAYILEMAADYRANNDQAFNAKTAEYLAWLETSGQNQSDRGQLAREAHFNHFEPFYLAAEMYLGAFILVSFCWLASGLSVYETSPLHGAKRPNLFKQFINPQSLRLAALAIICLALVVHSWALWQRMAISGRPPVTNLYSSAVFIGWAAVVLGIALELLFRRGMGAAMAAWAGFGTLLVAHFLSGTSGDTFAVMQAVLDTQFWLATHVVCVTLGYATTFLAGSLGIAYIVGGLAIPRFATSVGKDLARMVYGILCFAIFFSFVGTVLGGLWADDSWGRFWGWDPKENGALIIVLWNALVLHARWAGMVRDRGLAVLAVAGNITTAWSWFGVNELGLGLHSYGFTEGMLAILGIWCLIQLVTIAAGSIPKKYWLGFKGKPDPSGT